MERYLDRNSGGGPGYHSRRKDSALSLSIWFDAAMITDCSRLSPNGKWHILTRVLEAPVSPGTLLRRYHHSGWETFLGNGSLIRYLANSHPRHFARSVRKQPFAVRVNDCSDRFWSIQAARHMVLHSSYADAYIACNFRF